MMRTKVNNTTYLHICAWRPVVNTWTHITNTYFFATYICLTSALICKHLPKYVVTAKGHLKLAHKNVWSTKPNKPTTITPTIMTNAHPTTEPTFRTNLVSAKTI